MSAKSVGGRGKRSKQRRASQLKAKRMSVTHAGIELAAIRQRAQQEETDEALRRQADEAKELQAAGADAGNDGAKEGGKSAAVAALEAASRRLRSGRRRRGAGVDVAEAAALVGSLAFVHAVVPAAALVAEASLQVHVDTPAHELPKRR